MLRFFAPQVQVGLRLGSFLLTTSIEASHLKQMYQ
jgi:hypothetical protein